MVVMPVTMVSKPALTCENAALDDAGVVLGTDFSTRRCLRSQPVDKAVD
jgi:hypothetical protein